LPGANFSTTETHATSDAILAAVFSPAPDVPDTPFSLRRPSDHSAAEGARFEVHIEKARRIHGEHVTPFEARLELRDCLPSILFPLRVRAALREAKPGDNESAHDLFGLFGGHRSPDRRCL
jgi:hypothetical protein